MPAVCTAALHFDLPPVLRWFTANIGIHHVHHLSARIPSYRLGEVLRDHPGLRGTNRLTLRHSLLCFRLALWDESAKRLVSFREAKVTEPTIKVATQNRGLNTQELPSWCGARPRK